MAHLMSSFLIYATVWLLSCHYAINSFIPPTSTRRTSTTEILSHTNNETEWQALVSFKSMISNDPNGSLSSWNDSVHFCHWRGVTCGRHRHAQSLVIALNLRSLGLDGRISPAISNLTFLRKIDLSDNQLHGSIPKEIGHLSRLHSLNLTENSLQGGIPAALFYHCSQLQTIILYNNTLEGEIPSSLGHCLNLRTISLTRNSLSGHIPHSLGNLSSLSYLDLSYNQLSGGIPPSIGNLYSLTTLVLEVNPLSGSIPPSLGKLSNLQVLVLYRNQLTGTIPTCIWNLSSLHILYLGYNNLIGSLPPNLGLTLPLLEEIDAHNNQLHGPIPISLSNASGLQIIQLPDNMLTGTIPTNLGSLQDLGWLVLQRNYLGGVNYETSDGLSFLHALTNCTNLYSLQLHDNNLTGSLPNSIANLSRELSYFTIGDNYISGNISPEIGNLASLSVVQLGPNMLTGIIPASFGLLQEMHILDMFENHVSGKIPSTLGNLTQLNVLILAYNELDGVIPTSLGNCQQLNLLDLGYNKLSGPIPKEILTLSSISRFLTLGHNSLTGSIPSEVGSLINLPVFGVEMNKLSGEIPSSLGECQELQEVYLSGNFFHGSIPPSLKSLRGVQILDLSQNNLSGSIPDFLQDFRLLYNLNLSFNNFEGEVPKRGVFTNASAVSLTANNKLCGGNPFLRLPPCSSQSTGKKKRPVALALIISSISLFLFLLICCFIATRYRIKKSRKEHKGTIQVKEQHAKISYAELMRATGGFSTDNLIGKGSFGSVYKGTLDDDSMPVIAVKVLHLQLRGALKSFMSECEALRNIRHRNLVKIVTVCSSIDHRGNDFKAIVFEFMANGNLDDWLHYKEREKCEEEMKRLNVLQRLNIAIDVASALDYLHHHGETPIVHCDLKPSNILLDAEMTAHLGDFGMARFLWTTTSMSSQEPTNSTGLRGTIGYVAPEYGMASKVSTHGDVYSYGILLLELFTGKRPTHNMFEDGLTLRKFVESALFNERIQDVMDVQLLTEEAETSDDAGITTYANTADCVASVLRIGIFCSNELPTERMEVGDIISSLHKIRVALSGN